MENRECRHYDIIVVGGGMAGVFAAVAAGESGKKILLVERNQCLGGTGTSSMVSELMGVAFHGEKIYGGAVGRYFDEMERKGYAMYNYNVPMSSNPNIHIDRLRCNPEYEKILLEKMVLDAKSDLVYGAVVDAAKETENGVWCSIKTLYDSFEATGSFLIDATGNAAAAYKMGLPTFKNDSQRLQTSTLIIKLGNVDIRALQASIADRSIQQVITKGFREKILRGRIMGFAPIPNTNETTVNVVNANIDHEDAFDITRGLIETHQQIPEVLAFIRENVAGCSGATLIAMGDTLGVRDARRLRGSYELTFSDLKNCVKFPDCAAIGCYPLDIHDPITNTLIWEEVPDLYQIPFRSMYCRESKRVIVTGKAISATTEAFAAVRVMPSVMNLGEAAGCLAAQMVSDGSDLATYRVERVHSLMRARKMNV